MFRELLRRRQALREEECREILSRGVTGVLAVQGDDGYPYAVPLNYVYAGGKLYFHGGGQGHRKDAIRRCDKASFCVIDRDAIVPEEYTAYFSSVIVFGRVRELTDAAQAGAALRAIGKKYGPGDEESLRRMLDKEQAVTHLQEMTIEHMSGKEAIELVRAREADKNERA